MTVLPSDLTDYVAGDPAAHIEAATQAVQDYCGWHIAPDRQDTVVVLPTGASVVFLPSLYVTAVGSVTSVGTDLVADVDYTWAADGTLTRVGAPWVVADPVTVTFTHGYDDFPASVRHVIVTLAQRSIANPGPGVRQTAGPFSIEVASRASLQDDEKELLAPYKLPVMA